MDKKVKIVLQKISSECIIIGDMITDYNKEKFLGDEVMKRAISMSLINIGELVKLLPMEFRQQYSNIPFRLIAGLRDIVAHKYQTLNMVDIWNTATKNIPELKTELDSILESI
jgi:uncharacterized protein with HEPN domain